MIEDTQIRETDMPAEMQILLDEYPRDGWTEHPNFAEATQNWLRAHKGFRQLGNIVASGIQKYIDKDRAPEDFAEQLGYYGNILVGNLHAHHGWEDREYFPELSAADSRFDKGLEILESDHQILNGILDRFTEKANRALQLIQLDEKAAREESGPLRDAAELINKLLRRHLGDEEELAVPIILHYKLRE